MDHEDGSNSKGGANSTFCHCATKRKISCFLASPWRITSLSQLMYKTDTCTAIRWSSCLLYKNCFCRALESCKARARLYIAIDSVSSGHWLGSEMYTHHIHATRFASRAGWSCQMAQLRRSALRGGGDLERATGKTGGGGREASWEAGMYTPEISQAAAWGAAKWTATFNDLWKLIMQRRSQANPTAKKKNYGQEIRSDWVESQSLDPPDPQEEEMFNTQWTGTIISSFIEMQGERGNVDPSISSNPIVVQCQLKLGLQNELATKSFLMHVALVPGLSGITAVLSWWNKAQVNCSESTSSSPVNDGRLQRQLHAIKCPS